jgi:hypothetical protein
MPIRISWTIALFAAVAAATAVAQPTPGERLKLIDADFMQIDSMLEIAKGHPNEVWRWQALKSYQSGRHAEAVERFRRAASFADKHSQHYLSLIYWYGQGVARDPVEAYIWSDLAAERGSRRLLAIREKMWTQLTPAQQQLVEARGPASYARYGDDTARPRAEAEIRQFSSRMTGSRVGFDNQRIDIMQGGPINGSWGNATPGILASSEVAAGVISGNDMYGDQRTVLAHYWKEQDRTLNEGSVEVGAPRSVSGRD